nr:unnamed protein product [Callosobruchus analis]
MDAMISEINERRIKERNIIIYKLPMNTEGSLEDKRQNDIQKVKQIINAISSEVDTSNISVKRLGRATGDKLPPLKAVLRSREDVSLVLANKKKLKNMNFGVQITTDKTELQRKQLKRVISELEQKKQSGSDDLYIKYINGNPVIAKSKNLQELNDAIERAYLQADAVIIMGDININLLKPNSPESRKFASSLSDYGLVQVVNSPTRVTETTETLIDVICVSEHLVISDCATLDVGDLSDHMLSSCNVSFECVNDEANVFFYRDFNNFNMDWFASNALNNTPWENVNDKVDLLNGFISALFDTHAPVRTVFKNKKYRPYITYNIKRMMAERKKAYNKYLKTKHAADRQYYIRLRNEENCQNYIRILTKTAQGRLLACGTNAFKPQCREYNILNKNYTLEKEKPGQALCPYDPHHNSTAIYVGKYKRHYFHSYHQHRRLADKVVYKERLSSPPKIFEEKFSCLVFSKG